MAGNACSGDKRPVGPKNRVGAITLARRGVGRQTDPTFLWFWGSENPFLEGFEASLHHFWPFSGVRRAPEGPGGLGRKIFGGRSGRKILKKFFLLKNTFLGVLGRKKVFSTKKNFSVGPTPLPACRRGRFRLSHFRPFRGQKIAFFENSRKWVGSQGGCFGPKCRLWDALSPSFYGWGKLHG